MRLTNPNVDDWRRYKAYRHMRELLFFAVGVAVGLTPCFYFGVFPNSEVATTIVVFGGIILLLGLVLEIEQRELTQQVDRYLND